MKARLVARLVMHSLLLLGLLGFFASFPAMLPGLLLSTVRIDLVIKNCSAHAEGCLALTGFWVVIIVGIALLVMDIRMLRKREGLEARLWRSLAMELLLPAGWYATMSAMGGADVVGPMWLLLPGPGIMLSALASAVVAWLMVKDSLQAAVDAARAAIAAAIALVLSLIGGALAYMFADLLISQF